MKKIRLTGFFLMVLFQSAIVLGQEPIPDYSKREFHNGFYVGGQASTNGLGANVAYVLGRKFTIKAGYEKLDFNIGFNYDEDDISYDANVNYQTGGLFLAGEYYYSPKLYLSVGGALNSFNPKFDGDAISDMKYGDIMIPATDVGSFSFMVKPGAKISPYAAAGVRKQFGARQSVVLNFETGFYYIGAPKIDIETTGLLSPTSNPAHGQKEYLEGQVKAYKFYPVVKLNLAFKLF